MSLSSGTRLGAYEIGSLLGVGGMGEVYRARDTRLDRDVAIKVLPESFAADPERVARFEREAKTLASLNHPNIGQIYGIENGPASASAEATADRDAGHYVRALVLELVEGPTLADRIARGPIPVDDALPIAKQIAEALEAAHELGIIHRDLKPANVKLRPDGTVKVLDFGLAKALEPGAGSKGQDPAYVLSQSPTITSPAATRLGVILGTAAYMAPEQAKGKPVDKRADIWAFGAVLYEMLTGKRAFEGEDVSEVLASALARDPDFSLVPANLHPRIRHLLRLTLEKNPTRRWQAIGDVRVELENALADPRSVLTSGDAAAARPSRWRPVPVLVASVVCSVITGVAVWSLTPSPPAPTVTRLLFALPDDQQFTNSGRQLVAMSPDGTQLAYVANSRLYLRQMRELQAVYIEGTETTQGGVLNPVFSPDGRSLAFWSGVDQTIKRIAVSGGAPVTIGQADAPFGMSWGPGDDIVVGQAAKGIMRVSANGGTPETVISVKNDELAHGPQILPGRNAVLFTVLASSITGDQRWDRASIVVQPAGSPERKTLIEGGRDARYLPTGHIVYARAGRLLAVPFDLDQLELTGEPVAVVEGVRQSVQGTTGTMQFSVSDTGSLVYIPGSSSTGIPHSLALVDRNGAIKRIGLPPSGYNSVRVSPSGTQLAIGMDDGKEASISVYDMSGASSMRRLTLVGRNLYPLWSGDGERILFQSNREGDSAIFWQRADGTGRTERLTNPEKGAIHFPESWNLPSRTFSFVVEKASRFSGEIDLWIYALQDKKADPLIANPSAFESYSSFSPDGRWIAYGSDVNGRNDIYVQPFPSTGDAFQITRGGGDVPLWSPDGKEVFYVNAGRLYSVHVQTQPTFTFSNPVPLPITGFTQPPDAISRQYDITPDGTQFIMLFPSEQTSAAPSAARPEVQVVLNWFEELKRLVPSAR